MSVVGLAVGFNVEGFLVGMNVGALLGFDVVGLAVGFDVVGLRVGKNVGALLGPLVVGARVGCDVGALVGLVVGARVGALVGAGLCVGSTHVSVVGSHTLSGTELSVLQNSLLPGVSQSGSQAPHWQSHPSLAL